MGKQPAFMFYPMDWETDEKVQLMTTYEEGLYFKALRASWTNDGLPDDEAALIRLLVKNTDIEENRKWREPFTNALRTVLELFTKCPDGRLRSLKLEEQRNRQLLRSQQNTRANLIRWESKRNPSGSITESFSYSSSIHKKEVVPKARDFPGESVIVDEQKKLDAEPLDAWAEAAYASWGKRGDRNLAFQYLSELTPEHRKTFDKNLPLWVAYHAANGWQFAPSLAKFVIDQSYRYEPAPVVKNGQPVEPV